MIVSRMKGNVMNEQRKADLTKVLEVKKKHLASLNETVEMYNILFQEIGHVNYDSAAYTLVRDSLFTSISAEANIFREVKGLEEILAA